LLISHIYDERLGTIPTGYYFITGPFHHNSRILAMEVNKLTNAKIPDMFRTAVDNLA
jgi:hypothetical protein